MSTSLSRELNVDETTALTWKELHRMMSGRVPHMKARMFDLEEHKGPFKVTDFLPRHISVCFILLTASLSGKPQRHWACLTRNSSGIDFFDSLALKKHEIAHVVVNGKAFVDFMNRERIKKNTRKLQSHSKKIRTCGLWCVVRAAKFKMQVSRFVTWFLSVKSDNHDDLVAKLCWFGLLSH